MDKITPLKDIASDIKTKRGYLAMDIKKERKYRDKLLREKSGFENKFWSPFLKSKIKNLGFKIAQQNQEHRAKLRLGKEVINKEEEKVLNQRKVLIEETILKPLREIKNLSAYYKEDREQKTALQLSILSEENFRSVMDEKRPREIRDLVTEIQEIAKRGEQLDIFYLKFRSLIKDHLEEIDTVLQKEFHPLARVEFANGLINSVFTKEDQEIKDKLACGVIPYYKSPDITWKQRYKYLNLTNHFLENKTQDLDKWLEEEIGTLLTEERFAEIPIFSCYTKRGSVLLMNIFKEKISNYLENKLGITGEEFFKYGHYMHEINWHKNLNTMVATEKKQKGIIKKLATENGIREFYRYSIEILLDQQRYENDDLPFGVSFLAHSDHNDAFDGESLSRFYEQSKNTYKYKVFEISNGTELFEHLIELVKRYPNNKLSYLILEGHGSPNSLDLSSWLPSEGKQTIYKNITTDTLTKKTNTLKYFASFFEKDATIILNSCSTGAEGGFAQNLHNSTGLRVLAPNKDSSGYIIFNDGKIGIKYGEADTVEFV